MRCDFRVGRRIGQAALHASSSSSDSSDSSSDSTYTSVSAFHASLPGMVRYLTLAHASGMREVTPCMLRV